MEEYLQNPRTQYLAEEYFKLEKNKIETESLLLNETDEGMLSMANKEIENINQEMSNLESQIKSIAEVEKEIEEKPKALIIEMQAGAGGDESSLFAAELALAYQNYA